jgi:hypothetical protein
MKKILSTRLSLFLFTILLVTSCQKEPIDKEGDCRLTKYHYYDAAADYNQIDYFSYKNGLVDEWLASSGGLFKMEYDRNKKLKTSRMYEGETLVYTIHFIYEKDKVVKEIWYDGNTQQVANEVINTYNQKGELIRNEATNFDYYTIYTYTRQGYLESWFYFSGGSPIVKAEYTYNNEFKNPYGARPGIEYSFPYVNSGFGSGKRWYSSERITLYDEDGNPSVLYDQDPMRTVWQSGPKNYPLQADYFDRLSGGPITNTFEYENCDGSNDKNTSTESLSEKGGIKNSNVETGANFKSLINSPKKEVIEKMKALRKQKIEN